MEIETAHAPPARIHHAIALLPDGKVLLFGGEDPDGNALGDTWILDPDAVAGSTGGRHGLMRLVKRPLLEDWNQIDDPNAPEARYGHSMVTLSDGRVVLFGGQDATAGLRNDLHIFNGNRWEHIFVDGARPDHEQPFPRAYHNAWVYQDKVYIQGGVAPQPDGGYEFYQDLWKYDPSSNTWEELARAPQFISPHAQPFFMGSTAYLVDPHKAAMTGRSYSYDMEKDQWNQFPLENAPPGGEGKTIDYYNMVQTNGAAHLFGGGIWDSNTETYSYSQEVWRYDWDAETQTGTFTKMGDMPHSLG